MVGENYMKVVAERNDALDAIIATQNWIEANRKMENTAYPGDARKELDVARDLYLNAMAKVQPMVEKRRNHG